MAKAPDEGRRRLVVPGELGGERLDRVLVRMTEGYSRSRLQALVRAGLVALDGQPVGRPNTLLEAGAELVIDFPPCAEATSISGEPIRTLDVLYEDDDVVVIDKPAGLLSHANRPGQEGTVVELAAARFGELPSDGTADQDRGRAGIVHRLDRLTSGAMVLARTPEALSGLKAQFRERRVDKTYLAICHGSPRFDSEWIEAPIGPMPKNPDRFRVVAAGEGRAAATFLETREAFEGFSLVAASPKTGRTHQIRVHLRHVGLPIVGDRVYKPPGALKVPVPGDAPRLERQALHAARLVFEHPRSGERVEVASPLAADVARFLEFLRARSRA